MSENEMTSTATIESGQRVRVKHSVVGRDRTWTSTIEGVVQSCDTRPTGSWFAHGKNDKLWLQRIMLKKDDGELVLVNVDSDTEVSPV